MKLYGFMQDDKWHEDVGHIMIGLVPFWGWWREHRQWPPGDGRKGPTQIAPVISKQSGYWFDADRVADSYRDFLGYAIGDLLRTGGLLWLILT